MQRYLVFLVLFLSVSVTTSAHAQPEHEALLRTQFQAELQQLADDFDGVAGLAIVDLTSKHRFEVRGEWVFPQASAIKVHSDNTSTNVLIDRLSMDSINALATSLGAPKTRVQRRMIEPEKSALGQENISTPQEAVHIMERLAACDVPMKRTTCDRVLEILAIPKDGPTRTPVPSSVPIAFKPGGIVGVTTTWALVGLPGREYAMSVMSNYGGDGNSFVEAVSRAAYRYFSKLAGVTPYGTRVPQAVWRRLPPPE